MNQYSQLLNYLKSLADNDVFINTVTKGDWAKQELNKNIKFPQCHINVTDANFNNGSTIVFGVQIGVFDIRDISKENTTDVFWEQDNEVDNHNETLAVLNRMWLKMYTDFELNNITASENPTLDIQSFVKSNTLDGWILNFDVEMPNVTISLCEPD
jgi:hypothetical protein